MMGGCVDMQVEVEVTNKVIKISKQQPLPSVSHVSLVTF